MTSFHHIHFYLSLLYIWNDEDNGQKMMRIMVLMMMVMMMTMALNMKGHNNIEGISDGHDQ